MYCQSNNWWRSRKITWPSQNIWTLKKSSQQDFITRTLALNMTTISKYDVSKIFKLLWSIACVYVNLPLFKYYCRRGNHIFPSKHLTRPKYFEFTTDSLYKLPYQTYARHGGTCGDSGDPPSFLLVVFKVQIFWEGHKKSSHYFWLYVLYVVKSKGKISQNFVALSEYVNFKSFFVFCCHHECGWIFLKNCQNF